MEKSEAIDSLSALLPFVFITFIIVMGVILLNQRFRKNLYKQQLEQEQQRLQYQQNILQTSIQVQEDERERIAKDLHDELGAMLSISKRWLIQLEEEQLENTHKIAEIRELIETVLVSVRRISHDLMPLQLENMGIEDALHSLAKGAEKSGNVQVNIALPAHLENLDSLLKLSLYRILSELINNSLKYAKADQIFIEISDSGSQLLCSYTDNGIGIQEEENIEGLGIRSIASRVASMNGSWEYGNRIHEEGFFAQLKLPLTPTTKIEEYEQ